MCDKPKSVVKIEIVWQKMRKFNKVCEKVRKCDNST